MKYIKILILPCHSHSSPCQPEIEEKKIEGPFVRLDSVPKPHRQSFRMQRKNMLRKTLSSDKWRGAARKVKVRCKSS